MSAFSQIDKNDTLDYSVTKELALLGSKQLMYNKYMVGQDVDLNKFNEIRRLNRILKYSTCYSDFETKCLTDKLHRLI